MKKLLSVVTLFVTLVSSIVLYASGPVLGYFITTECVSCGSCSDCCPVEAVYECDDKYAINQDVCIECGTCFDNCPIGAIVYGVHRQY